MPLDQRSLEQIPRCGGLVIISWRDFGTVVSITIVAKAATMIRRAGFSTPEHFRDHFVKENGSFHRDANVVASAILRVGQELKGDEACLGRFIDVNNVDCLERDGDEFRVTRRVTPAEFLLA